MRRPRHGSHPCVRDALGLPSAPTKWGRPKQRAGRGPDEGGPKPAGTRRTSIPQGSKAVCPRPGSYGPGERNRRGYGAPQGARVSARTEMRSGAAARRHRKPRRCASRRSVPLDVVEGLRKYGRTRRRLKNTGDDACLFVIGCLTITSGRREAGAAFNPPHPEERAKPASRRTRRPQLRARLMVRDASLTRCSSP